MNLSDGQTGKQSKDLVSEWKTKYFLTREGFFERFNELVKEGKTKKEAYYQVENEREELCKPCLFSNWRSFERVLYRDIKKEMEK